MENRFLRRSGALCDGSGALAESSYDSWHRRGLSRRSLSAKELAEMQVPEDVIRWIPESVARENCVFPLSLDDECLTLAAADPEDIAVADKLRFILNKEIRLVGAPREAILRAINEHYEDVGESADSVLQEFTDTAIDFPETNGTREEVR
jgi:type IV pilus assembly protein PilB